MTDLLTSAISDDTLLSDLHDLSARCRNALANNGIKTVGELRAIPVWKFRHSFYEVRARLSAIDAAHGADS
jgi:hypothetical protein